MNRSLDNERGYTLLIAILVSGVVLSIGLAILNITLKEFQLSSFTRESEVAFYAADAGIECALYWDESSRDRFASTSVPSNIVCGGSNVKEYGVSDDVVGSNNVLVGGRSNGTPSEFGIKWSTPGSPELCTLVSVTKNDITTQPSCPAGITCTTVVSRGYNGCDFTHPRIVERALRTSY